MVLLEVITHAYPIWNNIFFYLFIIAIGISFVITLVIMKALKKKTTESKLMEHQHVARIDVIRKEHTDKLENLRIEMLKREEERSRQWIESEKETLHVLNGVSNLLELSDKVDKVEFKKINKKLDELILKMKNNGKT